MIRSEVEACTASNSERISTLEKPLHIVLDLRQLAPDAAGQRWYIAYRDPDPTMWHGVETRIHSDGGLISANTDHFSVWSGSPEDSNWRFTWQDPGVSTFSGAAAYAYPIELPPGRGGLQPNVDISYSSRGVDGHTISDIDQEPTGLGRSINSIEIARAGVRLEEESQGRRFFFHPDEFLLVLDGAGYELKTDEYTGNAVVRYYATNAPQLYIERRYDPNGNMTGRTENGKTYTQVFNAENRGEEGGERRDHDLHRRVLRA